MAMGKSSRLIQVQAFANPHDLKKRRNPITEQRRAASAGYYVVYYDVMSPVGPGKYHRGFDVTLDLMSKGTYRTALMLMAALAIGAASVEAAEFETTEVPEAVRVMNNHGALIRVYAEDTDGELHRLGAVRQGELAEFEIPAEIADESFRIKVYPSSPIGEPRQDFGVKTNPISLDSDRHVTVWVERDLTRSVVELARG